ncbi:MAG: hypothetical protein J6L66_07205 [Anaerotignum sp.]|nr:hypothetical protein [Anaerotignum sp.]MBP3307392.1 hypothetical protein [Anaerotignum sp.]MBP3628201.1 hypothetical protein [Anaerotignum sp.]
MKSSIVSSIVHKQGGTFYAGTSAYQKRGTH